VTFGRNYFVGFIISFYLEGHIYQFTTYSGSKISDLQKENTVLLKVIKGTESIDVKIPKHGDNILLSPKNGDMNGRIKKV